MPRNLKPLFLTQNRQPQLWMRRPTLRYPVEITLQIAIQRSNTLPELSPQPVEESTDLLTEYRQVTRLMTLGTMILILMSVTTCTHTHNIVPLLALCTWNNCLHRGHEQPRRQNNNINVQTGNAPYPRPWDNQLYGRCTRSQQVLHARAYRKIQCRYPIQ